MNVKVDLSRIPYTAIGIGLSLLFTGYQAWDDLSDGFRAHGQTIEAILKDLEEFDDDLDEKDAEFQALKERILRQQGEIAVDIEAINGKQDLLLRLLEEIKEN